MLIVGGVLLIGGVSFLLLLGSGTTSGKGSFAFDTLLPISLYALGGFCIYYGWKLSNSPKLNY